MDFIFEVDDKNGKKIRLTQRQYSHMLRRHSYMYGYIEEIKETIMKPDKLIFSNFKGYYYKGYKNLKSPNRFIVVVVRYLNNHGFVLTSYAEKNIS